MKSRVMAGNQVVWAAVGSGRAGLEGNSLKCYSSQFSIMLNLNDTKWSSVMSACFQPHGL